MDGIEVRVTRRAGWYEAVSHAGGSRIRAWGSSPGEAEGKVLKFAAEAESRAQHAEPAGACAVRGRGEERMKICTIIQGKNYQEDRCPDPEQERIRKIKVAWWEAHKFPGHFRTLLPGGAYGCTCGAACPSEMGPPPAMLTKAKYGSRFWGKYRWEFPYDGRLPGDALTGAEAAAWLAEFLTQFPCKKKALIKSGDVVLDPEQWGNA